LLSEILLNELDLALFSTCESEIIDGLSIDWEISHGGTVFWGHVGDGGSISKSQVLAAWSVEFDELANDTSLSEHLDAGKDKIGSGGMCWEFSSQSEADNFRQDHGDGLTKHDGLSFESTNTPTSNTKTVDHGGVGISSDNRVVVEEAITSEDDSCKIFEIDLMDNTGAWWDDLEVVEGSGTPLQELESFSISIEFNDLVLSGSIWSTGHISLDGVIDNKINWAEWVDLGWITTESLHSISHGSKIDNGWDSSEILQDDSCWLEWNIGAGLRVLFPSKNVLNIGSFDGVLVTVSHG